MCKFVVRSVCQLSFLLNCNIFGYIRICCKWLMQILNLDWKLLLCTSLELFPKCLLVVFTFAVWLVVFGSSLPGVGVQTVSGFLMRAICLAAFFQTHCMVVSSQLKIWMVCQSDRQAEGMLNTTAKQQTCYFPSEWKVSVVSSVYWGIRDW